MSREYRKMLIIIGLVAGIMGIMYYFNFGNYFSLAYIKQESEHMRLTAEQHYHSSVVLYMLVFILSLVVCIPSTVPLVLLGGYLFGTFWGGLFATLAAMIGSVISFLLFRYLVKSFLQDRYAQQIAFFKQKIEQYGVRYLLVLHYTSVVPFFVINMIAALTPISLGALLGTCFIGSFPLYLLYAFTGQQLSDIQSARDIFSGPVILAIVILMSMVLIPMIARRYKNNKKG